MPRDRGRAHAAPALAVARRGPHRASAERAPSGASELGNEGSAPQRARTFGVLGTLWRTSDPKTVGPGPQTTYLLSRLIKYPPSRGGHLTRDRGKEERWELERDRR